MKKLISLITIITVLLLNSCGGNSSKKEQNPSKNSLIRKENNTSVVLKINYKNNPPNAKDDNTTTEQAKAITIEPLKNDSDVDIKTNIDRLTLIEVKSSNNAKVVIKDNTIIYTPNKTFFGKDSITYTIKDKAGAKATAKINIDVKEHPYITKLELSLPKTEINKDETVTPTIIATYSNNTTKEIKDNIEFASVPSDAIEIINNNSIKFVKNTKVSIRAAVKNSIGERIFSDLIDVNVVWIEDGYILPPKPVPKINNSTLLGIDSNNNGVRDDVEIKIFE